jgi:cytochrome P450
MTGKAGQGNPIIAGGGRRRSSMKWAMFGETTGSWVAIGYNTFKQVARDPRFSSNHFHPNFPSVFPMQRGAARKMQKEWRTYSGMDVPEHTAHRRKVAPEFTARRIAELRPWVQNIVQERLDRLFKGHENVDLKLSFAGPVASEVICGLLGVSGRRIETWIQHSAILLGDGADRSRVASASAEFREDLGRFVAEKDAAPGTDLTSHLIAEYRRESIYCQEQIREFVGAIFLAGFESTASMIALGALTLLDTPEAVRAIASGVPGVTKRVVDELLRFHSIADLVTARVAVDTVEIAGCTILKGDGVVASTAAANRDPSVFTDPDAFDIGRVSRPHVAFGYGPHRCLGEHLARLEIEVALSALFTQFPHLSIADSHPKPEIATSGVFRGLAAPLIVTSKPSEC